jgi:hypothetical protein
MSEQAKPSKTRRESHLMPAEMTNPDLIRVVLSGLRPCPAIATPAGVVALTRNDVVRAGLDTLAVARWLQERGGFGAVAYLRPTSHRLSTDPVRPALHPVSYFVVPVEALAAPAAAEEDGTSAESAVA